MRLNWSELKPIISLAGGGINQYLSVLDEEGNILLTNARMQKELNLKNPRQERSNFFDLLHPVHIEDFRKALRYSMKNNNPYSMEFYLKNGHYSPMKWQINYMPAPNTKLKTFMCLGTFSEANTHSGADTKTNENIFRAFIENSPSLKWVLDEEGGLVYANDAFLRFFRFAKSALNKKLTDLLPNDFGNRLFAKHQEVLQGSVPVEYYHKTVFPGDKKLNYHVTIFPLSPEGGKKMTGGTAHDQSEKEQLNKKLEDTKEDFLQISRITSDAIWEWDMRTGEIFRNEKLVEMTGYLPEDHKGLVWWLGRVHPEDRDELNDTLKEITDKSLQSWESEYRFLCADGEYKNMHDHGFVIYKNGMPVKMIGALADITNEKLMENLLMEEKLRRHKEIAEMSIQVQERERTNIGRELHDNVNQILGASKLYMGMVTPANEEEKDFKVKSIEYTVMAIEEIRKLSRELVSPELKKISLVDNIRAIVDDINLTTEIKMKFTHDQESDLLSHGKKITLYRIVQEQVKNILKYSKAKQAEILLQNKDKNVQLVIKDSGVGFDREKTSSGVGLNSIQDRVMFYNGKVEILSSPGKGCQVNVSLPLLD